MDSDNVKDEPVGGIHLSLKEIVRDYSKPGGELIWLNIYGAPLKAVEGLDFAKTAGAMNYEPGIASLWKGRVLTHIEVIDTKAPE